MCEILQRHIQEVANAYSNSSKYYPEVQECPRRKKKFKIRGNKQETSPFLERRIL